MIYLIEQTFDCDTIQYKDTHNKYTLIVEYRYFRLTLFSYSMIYLIDRMLMKYKYWKLKLMTLLNEKRMYSFGKICLKIKKDVLKKGSPIYHAWFATVHFLLQFHTNVCNLPTSFIFIFCGNKNFFRTTCLYAKTFVMMKNGKRMGWDVKYFWNLFQSSFSTKKSQLFRDLM